MSTIHQHTFKPMASFIILGLYTSTMLALGHPFLGSFVIRLSNANRLHPLPGKFLKFPRSP